MVNIDEELIDWAVEKIKTKYKEDVALLIGQVGACKLPTDEQKMAFDYYVPLTEKGYQLAETFIIEDMGYDLYPMSFERLEGIADFEEPRMIWVLEKSEVIYAKEEKYRKQFEEIKETLHRNLADKGKTTIQALEFLNIAMEVYSTMQFEENLCKLRKAAGGISSMLTYALAMVNGLAMVDGYGDLIKIVGEMSIKPVDFTDIYEQMISATENEEIRSFCKKLILGVREILWKIKGETVVLEEAGYYHYEDLAFWYQEARYTFRKIAYYTKQKEVSPCYSLGCYLQIEFDAIQKDFGLKDMNLLGSFDAKNLEVFAKKAQELEAYLVEVIEKNNVKMNSYESLEEFITAQSQED